jgi:hypothetical protein
MTSMPAANAHCPFQRFCSLAVTATLCLALALAASAQTFTVLHTFTGTSNDGAHPFDGVVVDRSGNMYGVAYGGGINANGCYNGCGTVFKMIRQGSNWLYGTLYKFQGPPDGNYPAGVVIGPDGTLYGATYGGGIVNQGSCNDGTNGCGTVFRVQPPATFCGSALCPWKGTVLYSFTGLNGDAGGPYNGDLLFDSSGNIYGTTQWGGTYQSGAAYKLTRSQHSWSESVLYSFNINGQMGYGTPQSGLIMDPAGNLYGTTIWDNNYADGVAYQLQSGQSGYTSNVLYAFHDDQIGYGPQALTFDSAGNIIAATAGGLYNNGTVYKLVASDGWSLQSLYTFTGSQGNVLSRLTMDAAGNLYGAGNLCSNGNGCIFKLTPYNGGYTYTDLYDFTGGTDGQYPYGPVAIDANGNLYGTTEAGGDHSRCIGEFTYGCGVVWEITP